MNRIQKSTPKIGTNELTKNNEITRIAPKFKNSNLILYLNDDDG
eukprot:gene1643-12768_t